MAVFNQLPLTRACLESLRPTTVPFDLVVVDNGSTDDTARFFRESRWPSPLRYHRNSENLGLIRALNQGWRLAAGEFICFLHNDTEMRERAWLERLVAALERDPGTGLAGLYGARRVRRNGRYAGRTIIHCLADGPTIRSEKVEVAAVDGVCLFLRRGFLDTLGGFDEGYGFFHGYDRDLSFAVREAGGRCVVVNAPFVHRGGGTRARVAEDGPLANDLARRREALGRFVSKWGHRLPSDVRRPGERLYDWLRARAGGGS
jgi:GT2 family glycosyltransferase